MCESKKKKITIRLIIIPYQINPIYRLKALCVVISPVPEVICTHGRSREIAKIIANIRISFPEVGNFPPAKPIRDKKLRICFLSLRFFAFAL